MNFNFSEETNLLVKEISESTSKKIQNVDELKIILELSKSDENKRLFDEVIFLSKFMTNALSIMKRIGRDAEGYDKLISEYNSGMEKILSKLKLILQNSENNIQNYFENKYFQLNQTSVQNIVLLMEDLTIVKNWKLEKRNR